MSAVPHMTLATSPTVVMRPRLALDAPGTPGFPLSAFAAFMVRPPCRLEPAPFMVQSSAVPCGSSYQAKAKGQDAGCRAGRRLSRSVRPRLATGLVPVVCDTARYPQLKRGEAGGPGSAPCHAVG